jgi:hypothetical protein
MGTLKQLTVSAACAALLGLAASALVRTHFTALLAAMTTEMPGEPADEPALAGDCPSGAQLAAEDAMPGTQTILASTADSTTDLRSARSARPARSRQPSHASLAQKLNRGIRKLGERRYEIKRSTLELALGNLFLLSDLVRAEPEIRDGKPVGYRLFAIRADGPMAKLGLRNDDVLVSVNDLDLATPDRVLEAYSKLRTASRFALGLVRDGQPISQAYVIR